MNIKLSSKAKEYLKIFKNKGSESIAQRKLQLKLSDFYKNILSTPIHYKKVPDDLKQLKDIRALEDAWNTFEEMKIQDVPLPKQKEEFFDWYQGVNKKHKEEVKSFFKYLEKEASLEELGFYICLEEKVDGSFDDMIAMAQLGVQGKSKMVMAENYWDEMGNGHDHLVHTTMFAESADYMKNLFKDKNIDMMKFLPNAALKNGNILMMYSLRRRYIPRLLGCIGILEDTASERFTATVLGLERYHLPDTVIKYHRAHIQIDSKHGEEWLKHVLIPSVDNGDIAFMEEVCRGILIRFNIAVAYYQSIEKAIQDLKKAA